MNRSTVVYSSVDVILIIFFSRIATISKGYLLHRFSKLFSGKDYQEKENLKEMGDVSSGMASTVIQVYLKAILESFLHPKAECRLASMKVIGIVLSQGLVHPAQIVPYLICMATDSTTRISHAADRDLQVSCLFTL